MQVSTAKLDGGKVQLSITLEPEALQREVEQVYRDLGRRLNIPGFRKGKVPRALLERQVSAEAAQAQAIEHLVDEVYPQALDQVQIEPLDKAELEAAEVQEDGSLLIRATVTARPEVRLGEYQGLRATRHQVKVNKEQVQAEVDRLRARYSSFKEVKGRPIAAGDLVVVDYDLYAGEQKLEGKSVQGYPLEVGADRIFPELNEALEGAGPSQEVRFEVSYPADLPDPELSGKTVQVVVTPRSVRERALPSTEALAKRLGLASARELTDTIRKTLADTAEHAAEHELQDELIRQVVEGSYVEAPEVLVARELESRLAEAREEASRSNLELEELLRRQGVAFDQWRREQLISARADVKRALILDEIGRQEQVEVTDEELENELAAIATAENQPPAQIRRRLGPAGVRRLINRLYQRKILQIMLDHARVGTEEVAPQSQESGAGEEKAGAQ